MASIIHLVKYVRAGVADLREPERKPETPSHDSHQTESDVMFGFNERKKQRNGGMCDDELLPR